MEIFPFSRLPSELKLGIFGFLDVTNLKKMRNVSKETKYLVDSLMEHKLQIKINSNDCNKIFWLMFRRFLICDGFCPPAVWRLVIEEERDYFSIFKSLDMEYLFNEFYSSSLAHHGINVFKNMFTLTTIDLLKLIDPAFKVDEIPSGMSTLLTFNIEGLRFTKIWSNNFKMDQFNFNSDYANILILLLRKLMYTTYFKGTNDERVRNLDIPLRQLHQYISYPMDFGDKLMTLKLEQKYQIKLEVKLRGSKKMRQAILMGKVATPDVGDVFTVSMIWQMLWNGKSKWKLFNYQNLYWSFVLM